MVIGAAQTRQMMVASIRALLCMGRRKRGMTSPTSGSGSTYDKTNRARWIEPAAARSQIKPPTLLNLPAPCFASFRLPLPSQSSSFLHPQLNLTHFSPPVLSSAHLPSLLSTATSSCEPPSLSLHSHPFPTSTHVLHRPLSTIRTPKLVSHPTGSSTYLVCVYHSVRFMARA